jgi:hypothetical protein
LVKIGPALGAYIQVSDFMAIMALLFIHRKTFINNLNNLLKKTPNKQNKQTKTP